MRRKGRAAEERLAEVHKRLTEAEKGRKEAEDRLAVVGASVPADTYLKVCRYLSDLYICFSFQWCFLLLLLISMQNIVK